MKVRLLPAEQVRVPSIKKEHHTRRLDRNILPKAQSKHTDSSNERLLQIVDAITRSRREQLARQRLAQQELVPSRASRTAD